MWFNKKLIFLTLLSASVMSGCATSALIHKDNKTYSKTTRITLVEDNVIAFAKPAQALNNLPADSVVIAGQKNSYVLTQGGSKFVQLISYLDPKNIQISKELTFYSANNDGHFSGVLPLAYVKLQEDFSKKDLDFFIQNGAEECSSTSDKRMNAQRFCFNIKLAGVVYPVVSNITSLKPLSKPYQVSIYTNKEETYYTNKTNGLQKLVLLPFAVTFDVISLPFLAVEKIFD